MVIKANLTESMGGTGIDFADAEDAGEFYKSSNGDVPNFSERTLGKVPYWKRLEDGFGMLNQEEKF